jgi:hypothetical protein
MIHDVYLQVKRTGRTPAPVPDLPGCSWLAAILEIAWDRAEQSISAHLAWLRPEQPMLKLLSAVAHRVHDQALQNFIE